MTGDKKNNWRSKRQVRDPVPSKKGWLGGTKTIVRGGGIRGTLKPKKKT